MYICVHVFTYVHIYEYTYIFNFIIRSLIICTPHHVLFGFSNLRRMRWARHVACIRQDKGVYSDLVGIHEGERPLGRPSIPFITRECTV